MTRQEFIDDYNDWADLIEFDSDYDYNEFDDVYDQDDAFSLIDVYAMDLLNDYGWHDAYDFLESIPWDSEYYYRDDADEWHDIADALDFEEVKGRLLEAADEDWVWDDGDEEEDVTETDITVGTVSELTGEVSLDEYIAAIQPKRPETTFSLDQLFCQPADVL